MASDVKVAAERLRSCEYESPIKVYADMIRDCTDDEDAARNCADSDRQILAEQWLAEHDPTPITEELLRGLGFKQIEGAMPQHTAIGNLQTAPEFIDREGDRRWYLKDTNVSIPRQLKPKTRGQLLQLLDRLDITPEGKPDGFADWAIGLPDRYPPVVVTTTTNVRIVKKKK